MPSSILSRLSSSRIDMQSLPSWSFYAIGMTCVFTKYENENSVLPMEHRKKAIVEDVLATLARMPVTRGSTV